MTKAAEAKAKAAAKAKATAKKKKDDDDDSKDNEEEDPYNALSKMWKDTSKPPVGSFETCARCDKQFTVVCTYLVKSIPYLTGGYRQSILWLPILHRAFYVILAQRLRARIRSRSLPLPGNGRRLLTRGVSSTLKRSVFPVSPLFVSRYWNYCLLFVMIYSIYGSV